MIFFFSFSVGSFLALSPPLVQYLQERINDEMAEFYKEEPRAVPVALVRTLGPVDGGVHGLVLSSNGTSRLVHHGGKHFGKKEIAFP